MGKPEVTLLRNTYRCTMKIFSEAALMALFVLLTSNACFAEKGPPTVETVLRSTPLYGTNGLAIDKDDHLVIAAINPKAVFVMDTDTGKILKKYTDPLITGPDDVTIAKDGSIYFTDIFSGNIGKISPTGEVSLVVNLGPWVNSIRLSPDETKLYVGHCIGADRMTEIDLRTHKTRIVAENVGWPNSSSFGPDGRYYSPLNMRGEVIRWNLQTGEREVVFGLPSPPSSVKFDAKGRMLVTEFITGTIWRYDLNTKEKKMITKNVTIGLDNIAIDSKGRMFIASNHNGGIMEVYEDGRTREISPPSLLIPSGVAIMSSPAGEELAVADYWNVRFFDTKTFKQTHVIPSGFYPWVKPTGKKEFAEAERDYNWLLGVSLPITVAPVTDGDTLVISSWPSNCINIYDLNEKRITRTIDGNRPIYAMKFGDNLVVSELETHSVVSISTDEKRQTLADGLGILKGADPEKESWVPDWLRVSMLRLIAKMSDGLVYPSGLAAQGKNLYVAEWFKGEVLQIVAEGQAFAKPKVIASGLEHPEGMAFSKDGSLLVIESAIGRLDKIDLASGKKSIVAENLKTGLKPGFKAAPSYVFSGVTVGSDGSIYVSCDATNEVVRIKE